MRLNNIFVTSIERTKNIREENLKNISKFGKKYFDINVSYAGIDGALIKNNECQTYINQGIIVPSHKTVISLNKMIYMDEFVDPRYMTASEIGVFLSHFAFWNYIVKNNIECSLILEDNAYFNHDSFSSQIKSVISDHDKMKFNLVSLFKHHDQKNTNKYTMFNEKFHKIDATCKGAVAYLLTLEGAKELLKYSVPIKGPVDYTMYSILHNCNNCFIIKDSIVSLFDNKSIKPRSIDVDFRDITHPKHIFSINNKEFKHSDYEVKHVYEDFSKSTLEDVIRNIDNGFLNPFIIDDLSLDNKNKLIFSKKLQRCLTCEEITTYISHFKVWQNIVQEKIPYAIVLEGKLDIDKEIFHEEIKKITTSAPCRFTTISLEHDCNEKFSRVLKENPNYFLSNKHQHKAYIISLLGAIHFVTNLLPIEDQLDMALNMVESQTNSGYIYKTNIIKSIPSIIELNFKKPNLKIDQLFYLGNNCPSETLNIFNLRPLSFCIDSKNLNIQNLINMNNGIVNPSLLENGKIMYAPEKRALEMNEISSYLSHVSIWSNIVDKKINAALIFNDDVNFVSSDDKLQELIDHIPHRGNLIFFVNQNKKHLKCNEFYCYNNDSNNKSLAYIITYKAAKDLLRIHKPIRGPIESLINTYALLNKTGYAAKETFFSND